MKKYIGKSFKARFIKDLPDIAYGNTKFSKGESVYLTIIKSKEIIVVFYTATKWGRISIEKAKWFLTCEKEIKNPKESERIYNRYISNYNSAMY